MEDDIVLRMAGVRVREVTDLAEGALWLAAHKLLLIDAELTPSQREGVTCRILGRALC